MDPKTILYSRTFWFNVVSLAATVAGYLPPDKAAIVLPVANVLLRLVTSSPVSLTGK